VSVTLNRLPVSASASAIGRLSVRAILALATVAAVASPFAVAFYANWRDRWIGPQIQTPARISAAELGSFHLARKTMASHLPPEPVILAYHDVTWNSVSKYTVTPAAFAAQMAMLRAAGYHALTAAELVRYLHGGRLRWPSVAITFDDGARGLWTYADPILRRYRLHGISFLITGRVGTHQPYYLTWQEIRLMHSSGRWDFESHTNALHEKVRISASGRFGDPLTELIWRPAEHRRETIGQFRRRVRSDLLTSIAKIRGHQLPRPRLFAYPFSESFGAPPYTASAYANQLIHRLFAGAMTNYVDPAVPVSRREATAGVISRLEVTRADTAASLLRRMRAMRSIPVGRTVGFRYDQRWQGEGDSKPVLSADGQRLAFGDNRFRWAIAAYAPGETADWDGYAVRAQIGGLDYTSNPNATISVRYGSASQLNVTVSNHYVSVTLGSVRSKRAVLATDLPPASAHSVGIYVRRDSTAIFIDGARVLSRPVTPGPASTGGFALSSFRPDLRVPYPVFGHLECRRLRQ
jgi:biofilm PGA synthesis lipoprotein PgaB